MLNKDNYTNYGLQFKVENMNYDIGKKILDFDKVSDQILNLLRAWFYLNNIMKTKILKYFTLYQMKILSYGSFMFKV